MSSERLVYFGPKELSISLCGPTNVQNLTFSSAFKGKMMAHGLKIQRVIHATSSRNINGLDGDTVPLLRA